MTLRLRLAVAAIAVAAATILPLLWIESSRFHEEAAQRLLVSVEHVIAKPSSQERCEASAATWHPLHARVGPGARPGPAPPGPKMRERLPPPGPDMRELPPPPVLDREVELFVYDRDLRPAHPDAPQLGEQIARNLAEAGAFVLPRRWLSDNVEVIATTPWRAGACAYVYARDDLPLVLRRIRPRWLLPLGAVLCAMLITMGPVVRRIRRLTDAVTASAATGFVAEIPVEGGDEIAALARSFAAASHAVRTQLAATEQREAILRDFLANTTHDVMIPLTVLQVHLSAMQSDEQAGRPRNHAPLTSAMDEAHYLGALLQNLAAIAKLDSGAWQPVIGSVDMNTLVHRVISRHRVIARRLDVTVEFAVPDAPVTIAGDITLLEQAVSNIVYNAVRHNRAGGHVAVVLEASAHDRFSLRVVDDGPGVPATELARLVERGFRGNAARTRSPDGLGLGLNITLRVAELHDLELRFGASEYGGLQVDLEGPRIRERP
ncbi:MAG TPA: HAMP domain-containing sensor histidine kinase [Kofleriaceae bacterium]|nr:HAMP domain-containing sensor histidine kinase [Kofleriaceae bacterium]